VEQKAKFVIIKFSAGFYPMLTSKLLLTIPEYVNTIVLSTQHESGIQLADFRKAVISNITEPVVGEWLSIKKPPI
jgi:hypothetical protein